MFALYGHAFSSYTWKALIPLYANETAFEFRALAPDFPDHAEFVRQHHPVGKFPILADGNEVVVEATAIIEYLAVHYPGPEPLIPADPAEAYAGAADLKIDRILGIYDGGEYGVPAPQGPPPPPVVRNMSTEQASSAPFSAGMNSTEVRVRVDFALEAK